MDIPGWSRIFGSVTPHPYTTEYLGWLIAALIVALILSSLTSASETALTSVNRIRIKNLAEEGDQRARQIEDLLKNANSFLTSILITNNVAIIVASALTTIIAINLNLPEALATVVLALVSLVFSEVAPKNAAVQNAESWALALTPFVRFLIIVVRPINFGITVISNALLRLLGVPLRRTGPSVTEEELMFMVNVGEEEGELEHGERSMILSIFELGDTTAREAMIPRIDMVALEGGTTIENAVDVITQGGQSRIPIYDGTIDNIIGVLYAKDLLRELRLNRTKRPVREIVRPAYFVPETKKLDDLLQEMRGNRVHMAIVSDEYGAVAGLVTIEDLIEEIVGDIKDEYDREAPPDFEILGSGEYLINAMMHIDDFNELIGAELESDEDYDTVGGLVLAKLDKIPSVGDSLTVDGVKLTVLVTKGRRVMRVRAHTYPPGAETDAEADEDLPSLTSESDSTESTTQLMQQPPVPKWFEEPPAPETELPTYMAQSSMLTDRIAQGAEASPTLPQGESMVNAHITTHPPRRRRRVSSSFR